MKGPEWSVRQLNELMRIVATSERPDWAALAKRFGRTERAVRARVYRLRVHGIRARSWTDAGMKCARCGGVLSWNDTEQDDPAKLCGQIAEWAREHTRCRLFGGGLK